MGAGILPTAIYKNKLYFLFGKENKYEKSAPGYSDFGGGTDNNENYLQTASREASEELTGYLGNINDIRKLLSKNGTYNIDYHSNDNYKPYRMHIFPFEYNEYLPYYFNNNQKFIQSKLNSSIFKKTKIFEKVKMRWFCINELKRKKMEFRHYFRNIIDKILDEKDDIMKFIKKKYSKTRKILLINNKQKNTRKK
jgi:hypothetical protein